MSNKPVYCRECRGRNTFERYPDGDIKTESGQAFMLKWRCKCGNTALTSNPDYKIPVKANSDG